MKTAVVAAGGCLLLAGLAGCGGTASSSDSTAAKSTTTPTPTSAATAPVPAPSDFTTQIDNPYWPLKPGTRCVVREVDEEGHAFTNNITVTSGTKKVAAGITGRVVRDTLLDGNTVVEDTYDWYAQDSSGNVWYLGEDTAEFHNGKVDKSGSFEAGVHGALPGIIMPASPQVGQTFREEFLKGEAEDQGTVLSTDEMVDVPAGHYTHLLMTRESTPLEPDALEYKFFARGVGQVLALGVSGDVDREELLKTITVSPAAAQAAAQTPLGKHYS
jgi:hypothetical protein